jgi:hypothetical protein
VQENVLIQEGTNTENAKEKNPALIIKAKRLQGGVT